MRAVTITAALLACAAPMPVLAQDTPEAATAELADRLGDPAEQQKLAMMLGVMSEMFMELPVAPLMDAVAQAQGEDAPATDPDATVRDLAGPGADRVSDEIAEKVPEMMQMMSGMAEGMGAMIPALEAMAEKMRGRMAPVN